MKMKTIQVLERQLAATLAVRDDLRQRNNAMLETLIELFDDVRTGKMICKDNATLVRLHKAIDKA
jgi:hypothetical protein